MFGSYAKLLFKLVGANTWPICHCHFNEMIKRVLVSLLVEIFGSVGTVVDFFSVVVIIIVISVCFILFCFSYKPIV